MHRCIHRCGGLGQRVGNRRVPHHRVVFDLANSIADLAAWLRAVVAQRGKILLQAPHDEPLAAPALATQKEMAA
jgi:hypothetical protein